MIAVSADWSGSALPLCNAQPGWSSSILEPWTTLTSGPTELHHLLNPNHLPQKHSNSFSYSHVVFCTYNIYCTSVNPKKKDLCVVLSGAEGVASVQILKKKALFMILRKIKFHLI